MLAPPRALASFVVVFCVLGCRGKGPLELPSDAPQHACAGSGVAACEAACNEQADAQACLVASIAHGKGLTVPVDDESMKAFERRACDLGAAIGCEYYANNLFFSKNEEDRDVAREYYDRACRAGRADSCMRAGYLLWRTDATGEPTDARAALGYFQQACEAGEASSCSIVGDLQTFGIGTRMNPTTAAASYRRACDGGDANGCHNAESSEAHWLTARLDFLFESLHVPDPVFVLENAPFGWRTAVRTRLCVVQDALEPQHVEVIKSSGQPALDAVVLETVQGWRIRVRPGVSLDRPMCFETTFDILKQ